MARGKKVRDTETVSDPSEGEPDSDDSMLATRRPKKKAVKKEQTKTKATPRKASPQKKRQKRVEEEEEAGPNEIDEDEDNELGGLVQDYDDDNLLNIEVPDAPIPCMAAEGGDRLIITDIIVENFKSYYGTRRIGPFHQSFTSIIGPNGSGKSNVIDAMLFVFGYKASKIRSKKVSVLIHSSNGKDDIPSCTVKISFQKIIDIMENGKAVSYQVVPNSGFSVSRTGYKNNSSQYRMDGKIVNFKAVADRLKKVGIDLIHNRFLILQGEVEQIAMMKPKSVNGTEDGMLEYLEDIIGSSRYKIPIEKLTNKLEKLQAERSHQITKVNTANREKAALDEPLKEMLEYMNMENEVAALKCKVQLNRKYVAEDAMDSTLKPQIDKIESDLTKVTTDLKEVVAQLKEKRDAADDMAKSLSKLQTDIHKAGQELEVLVQKDKKRVNDLARANTEMKKLNAEAKKEQQKLDDALRAPEEAKERMESLTRELDESKEAFSTAQDKYDENLPNYTHKTESHRAKKVKLEEEYSSVAARLAEAESKCKLAEAALRNMMEEYEKKKGQLEDVEKSLQANRDKLTRDRTNLDAAQTDIAKFDQQLKDARGEMEMTDKRMEEIKQRMDELTPLFNEKQAEAQVQQQTNKITKTFSDAQKAGKFQGWIGRIGDLGSVDPKYDRAMSNNFGQLDYHLNKTAGDAKEGTEILKKMGIRAQFLALDRQAKFWPQIQRIQAEKGTGFAPRLFNLIDCDDQYKPAFYFMVRGAYVVETIDDATQLSKQLKAANRRETIVSMDGCQITSAGNYIGGGRVKEGKMLTTGKPKPDRRMSMNKDDEAAARKLQAAQAEYTELEGERQNLGGRKRDLEYQISRLAQPLRHNQDKARDLDRQIKLTEDRIRVQEQQRNERERDMEKAKVDENETKKKEKEIEQLKSEREEVNKDSKGFKAKIREIDNDISKIYAKLVKPFEDSRDEAKENITKCEKELSKMQAVINGAARNIAKQQARVDDVNKDVELKKGKSTNLESQEEMYEKTKAEKQEALDELNKRKDEMEEKLKTFRDSTGELDTQEIALEKQQKLLNESLTATKEKMKVARHKIDECDKHIEALTLHNLAEILVDIPEEMRAFSNDRRFILDGESDNDEEEDMEEFMATSPSKKETKETKKGAKKRKLNEDEGQEKEKEMEMEINDTMDQGASTADEAPEEEMMTEEQREERQLNKMKARRERKLQRENDLKSGKMPEWSRRHIQNIDIEAIKGIIDTIESRLSSMKNDLNHHVVGDFKSKLEKLRREGDLLSEIKEKYVAHRDKLDGLKKSRLADFMGGFESISTALRELYQMITLGGDASLELKDVIDPFIEGVQFMVRPPKKSWKQIENLSGGEKTLSSLALVFALHKYRPTPLYVMDEIDAALDFRNVSIIGHYIKDRTKNAQFIIISLRNNMFELADRLIGIYKVNDCTRNVVVDPKQVLEETKDNRVSLEKVRRLMESNKIQTGRRKSQAVAEVGL